VIEYLFMAAGIIALVRAIAGPTFADRVISISSIISVLIFLMVLQAVTSGSQIYLDIAVVLMLLSFVGTLAVAGFIKPREVQE
jgi:multisubunit Na+/H+ antiporter MnhF subunit